MENLEYKKQFLKTDFTKILAQLPADAQRKWGKMDVQQMIEHMSEYVRIANGRTPMNVHTEADKLPRMQGFLMSEKPFPENTPNVLMPDTPLPARQPTKEAAIAELQGELDHFFAQHEAQEGKKLNNPFFGELDFPMQVQLLHKHATHHLRQFGAQESL